MPVAPVTLPSFLRVRPTVAVAPGELAVRAEKRVSQLELELPLVKVPVPPLDRQAVELCLVFDRMSEPVAKVEAAFVVVALNEANVPAPKADPVRETRNSAKRSFLAKLMSTASATS